MKSSQLRASKFAMRVPATAAAIAIAIAIAAMAHTATARSKGAWSVVQTQDPITGRSTCAVSALDRIGGMRFSRVGMLYAVVETIPDAGLLVGVSSGGKVRLPVGDIVWRVDDRPYRTLRAIDNPAASGNTGAAPAPPVAVSGSDRGPAQEGDSKTPASPSNGAVAAYSNVLEATMRQQSEMVTALTATATMASGEQAKAMLDEMLAGTSLLFRQQAATPLYGLPSANTYAVGQETLKGRKPIPIDQSFRNGLITCGIIAR